MTILHNRSAISMIKAEANVASLKWFILSSFPSYFSICLCVYFPDLLFVCRLNGFLNVPFKYINWIKSSDWIRISKFRHLVVYSKANEIPLITSNSFLYLIYTTRLLIHISESIYICVCAFISGKVNFHLELLLNTVCREAISWEWNHLELKSLELFFCCLKNEIDSLKSYVGFHITASSPSIFCLTQFEPCFFLWNWLVILIRKSIIKI